MTYKKNIEMQTIRTIPYTPKPTKIVGMATKKINNNKIKYSNIHFLSYNRKPISLCDFIKPIKRLLKPINIPMRNNHDIRVIKFLGL